MRNGGRILRLADARAVADRLKMKSIPIQIQPFGHLILDLDRPVRGARFGAKRLLDGHRIDSLRRRRQSAHRRENRREKSETDAGIHLVARGFDKCRDLARACKSGDLARACDIGRAAKNRDRVFGFFFFHLLRARN